ncbi:unnamed protein product [Arctia plantaginis]|uniref:Breast cancer type 2 susceptibility protein n=1 Tax=Arctia plantaginis TaxID=874455 RepID=A0A8S1BJS1_ARCPL|nr:unnamed protein product [Arctia plantaginis]
MNDPVQSFELILNKQNRKKSTALYRETVNQKQQSYKPQDVISSVFHQLKAIQNADSSKSDNRTPKYFQKYKNSTFSVNNLPTVDEEPPKHTTKFDTQCISDTQLMNVIEDAEILEAHQGMTQEFETAFLHTNTEHQSDKYVDSSGIDTVKETNQLNDSVKNRDNNDVGEQLITEMYNTSTENEILEFTSKIDHNKEPTNINNEFNENESSNLNNLVEDIEFSTETNLNNNTESHNIKIEQLSQVLVTKKTNFKRNQIKTRTFSHKPDSKDEYSSETESQFDQISETNNVHNKDRPPVFTTKNDILKSKSPSPLVFNLDQFEQFETMALSLLESESCAMGIHVINSQILHKELCFNMNKETDLTDSDRVRVVDEKVDLDVVKEIITIDNANSEKIVHQVSKQNIRDDLKNKSDKSNDVLKDEILFSSDEEEHSVHKEYQDLPFTCALETSFYNQSDVLDKTMYVGFQTASNRSIQICADSFARAKSILNDVTSDEITITELVNNCNSSIKEKETIDMLKECTLNLDQNAELSQVIHQDLKLSSGNLVGFMTANNKKIELSKLSLARCKKVFQDIDLDEKFDCRNGEEDSHEKNKDEDNNHIESELHTCDTEKEFTKYCENPVDNVIGFDEEMVQEFENIEMSLDDLNVKKAVTVPSNTLKINTKTSSEVACDNTENVLEDVPFHEKSNENISKENNINDNVLSQILGNYKVKTHETKTIIDAKINNNNHMNISKDYRLCAQNKNMIDSVKEISNDVYNDQKGEPSSERDVNFKTAPENMKITHDDIAQTKNHFKDSVEEIPKVVSNTEKYRDWIKVNHNQPSTSTGFLGFKTANNKNIEISKKAWSKSKNVFNDIDSMELPKKENKDYPNSLQKNKCKVIGKADSNCSNNEIRFGGFKAASNKIMDISNQRFANTKNIFSDINFTDLLSEKLNENPQDVNDPITGKEVSEIKPEEALGFVGFKSASNKMIKVSEKAIAQSKIIFKDIDTEFSKPPLKENQEEEEMKTYNYKYQKSSSEISTESSCAGFKTASNKNIQISRNALAKTKDIFKNIYSKDFKLPNVNKKDYPDFEEHLTEEHDESNSKNPYKSDRGITNSIQLKQLVVNRNPELNVLLNVEDKNKFIHKKRQDCSNIRHDTNPEEDLNSIKTSSNEIHVDYRPMSPVFNVPSALKRPVFAKSPKKSIAMFDDLENRNTGDIPINIGFVGFHTASNKQVKISDKALAKSKKIFQDLDSRDDVSVENTITKAKTVYPVEILQENQESTQVFDIPINKNEFTGTFFKGFQTASEKPVEISRSALEKCKKLFKEIDKVSLKAIGSCELERNKTTDSKTLTTAKGLNFKGFQTASHQKVTVSKESLVKAKQLFSDHEIQNSEEKVTVNPSNLNVGFQTGNNKAIAVSEEALAKSKRLFSEIHEECVVNTGKKEKKMHKDDIDAMLDTQVLNNFEETLYTEDFAVSPKNTKRSGSPILSCPRAKKTKKFEVPYNLKQIPKPIAKPIKESTIENNKISYRDNYKKNITFTLKDLDNMSKNMSKPIDPYLRSFTFENLLQFEFNHERNDFSSDNMTVDLLKQEFLNSVNAKLIPSGWIDNHLKLILWKLISYEIKFKSLLVCTTKNVAEQLKFRYDKELYNAQRPALRKIYEKDDLPSKTIVLCVVGIYVDDFLVSSVTDTSSNIELLLTDGWYSIRCKIDKMLTQIVCSGKICAGSKIATTGAELIGCEQGVSPWEDTSAIRLKISGNSTRRARWDAKLGYHRGTISSQLSSIQVIGGKVSKLRVLVTRVYPALYIEKFEDGSTVTRSERLENIHQMKTEAERQAFMEKLYEEVEKEFADQESQDSEGLSDSYKRTCMESGSQIAKMMKQSKDPAEFRAQLTGSQLHLLEAHTSKNRDRLLQDIQARVRDKIEKAGVCVNRNVVSLLKIRVAGVIEKEENVEVSKGMMSIWKPNDAIQEVIKEGAWIDVLNVIPTAVRYSEIQISASRQSVFSASKYKEPDKFKPYTKLLQRQWYTIKDLAQNPSMSTDYNEIDTVGLIFLIDPSIKEFDSTKQSFQNVYLADSDKNIICANFWGGLKKFGFQNVLDTGQVMACVNLQKRAGNTRKSIPQFRVTEFSYFTQTPKNVAARKMLEEFNKKLNGLDRRKFCQDCIIIKNSFSYTKNNENISPYRCINSDVNMSKNKVFIDSPLVRINKMDDNFNLTGLDFESTFKQDSQFSEEMLQRKKKVNEKIARLKMYGEPPPLSPIHIINRSKQACNSYKSPLISSHSNSNINNNIKTVNENSTLKTVDNLRNISDSSINVTTIEITPQKCGVQSEVSTSPVLLNRTYVKNVNPVKINFDVQENNDSTVDHFAEEFEGSPPLSLD